MPEPTSTAAGIATLAVTAVSTTAVTAFGIPLGLRADLLVAGLFGSLASIIVLNTVPGTGDTWVELVRTTIRRMFVALASSLTAGYLTPMFAVSSLVGEPWQLGTAFVVGAFAQRMLVLARDKVSPLAKPGAEGGGVR
jgi:hypothetical protein